MQSPLYHHVGTINVSPRVCTVSPMLEFQLGNIFFIPCRHTRRKPPFFRASTYTLTTRTSVWCRNLLQSFAQESTTRLVVAMMHQNEYFSKFPLRIRNVASRVLWLRGCDDSFKQLLCLQRECSDIRCIADACAYTWRIISTVSCLQCAVSCLFLASYLEVFLTQGRNLQVYPCYV